MAEENGKYRARKSVDNDGYTSRRRENGDRYRERSVRDNRVREKLRENAGSYQDRHLRDEHDRAHWQSDRDHCYGVENDRGDHSVRNRRHDYDREHRHKHRSRSCDRQEQHSYSRSRSRDHKSKRNSGFDLAPPGASVVPFAANPGPMFNPSTSLLPSTAAGVLPTLGSLAGLGQSLPGVFPSMFPFVGGTQATRHARRVYVGGLPPSANEQSVATFFSQVMAAIGGNTAGPGDAAVNVYINQEKRFAFVEMRTVEEASNAMSLDGIVYEGVAVRVKRPTDYNPSLAATLGPSQPSPHLNLAAVRLVPGAIGIADGPDRIFVGGLPYYLTEEQIIDLLSSFGPLRAFDLVKDRETGNSKGYGFCLYQDSAVIDTACAALNGLKMGDRTLTVRRASASGQPKPEQADVLIQAQQQIALQKLTLQLSGASSGMSGTMPGLFTELEASSTANATSKVVRLSQVIGPDELKDDNEYREIVEDMRDECGKYGTLKSLIIPRPGLSDSEVPSGVGMVFVEYSDIHGAVKAIAALNGRKFSGSTVVAMFYPEDKFLCGDYGG
eukprot:Gb_01836 [translate_table: standard]